MIKVRSDEWIDSNLYNKFPSVRVARNSIEERSQMAVADAFIHAIPELGGQAGITITHNPVSYTHLTLPTTDQV